MTTISPQALTRFVFSIDEAIAQTYFDFMDGSCFDCLELKMADRDRSCKDGYRWACYRALASPPVLPILN